MSKLNNEAAPNNNFTERESKDSKNNEHEFSEELSDGGERNEIIEQQKKSTKGVRLI